MVTLVKPAAPSKVAKARRALSVAGLFVYTSAKALLLGGVIGFVASIVIAYGALVLGDDTLVQALLDW